MLNDETILQEAQRLVSGARQDSYGDPVECMTRIGAVLTVVFRDKLRPGTIITPADVPLIMSAVKLVRESITPKRDNRVDLVAYSHIKQLVHETGL